MESPKSKFKYYAKETLIFILLIPCMLLLGAICAVVSLFAPLLESIDDYTYKMKYRKEILEEQENPHKQKDYLPWLHRRRW